MRRAVVICLAFLTTQPAYAWGPRGHEYIGAIAERILSQNNPAVLAKVQAKAGMDLRLITTWADCAKDVDETTFHYHADKRYAASCQRFESASGIAEMEDYVRRNSSACNPKNGEESCHKQYHYADVAIQHDHYKLGYQGTSRHDIVHAITGAIAVLQGNAAPAPLSFKDQREALYVLAHLIGDIHQPLHVGAVYLNAKSLPTNPDVGAKRARDTRGGNYIDDGSRNLHSEWDEIPDALIPESIEDAVIERAASLPEQHGAPRTWSSAWADDTVKVAKQAFADVRFSKPSDQAPRWVARFCDRSAYLKEKDRIQREQLQKAGARFAQLLEVLFSSELSPR